MIIKNCKNYQNQKNFLNNEVESDGTEMEYMIFNDTNNYYCYENIQEDDNKNELLGSNEAKALINNAINRNNCYEILRNDVFILRQAVNDTNNLKIIAQINNVFDELLQPIISKDALLDTWIIKNLLEIIIKLLPFSKFDNPISTDVITSIWKKWLESVEHPLGITTFIRSQQICRVCENCVTAIKTKETISLQQCA